MEYGLIFDMDGVVIDSNPYHKIAWERFLLGQGIHFDDQLFDNVLSGRTGPTSIRLIFGDDLPESKLDTFLKEVDGNYQNLLRESRDVKPIAGLFDFLRQIREKKIPMALATSAPELNIELGLQKLDLENTFQHILGKVDVNQGKPHPEVYLKALDLLGLPADQCIVFEDSRAGVRSALSAGIKVVGIASGHTKEELLEEGVAMAVNDFRDLELEEVLALIGNTKENLI